MNSNLLNSEEKAILDIRSLYEKSGYSQYKMSKFEEYELYIKNKDFLVSENIITFTDTNGKLMALKPDVTLSIIKNIKEPINCFSKMYYNENVYRISKGTHSFKEIMQVGLECMGDIDDYCIFEVISLAGKSLETISNDYVLDISDLDILSGVIDSMNLSESAKSEVVKCVGEKNTHEIRKICDEEQVDSNDLIKIINTYGNPDDVVNQVKNIQSIPKASLENLSKICSVLEESGLKGKLKIDFSLISDMNYYNGFVFKGFINGVATAVLSGGQYDKLMAKMKKNFGAIGFAVYLDSFEHLSQENTKYDVDAVVLYDDDIKISDINNAINRLKADNKTVMAQKSIPKKLKYKELWKIDKKGVERIENNA